PGVPPDGAARLPNRQTAANRPEAPHTGAAAPPSPPAAGAPPHHQQHQPQRRPRAAWSPELRLLRPASPRAKPLTPVKTPTVMTRKPTPPTATGLVPRNRPLNDRPTKFPSNVVP